MVAAILVHTPQARAASSDYPYANKPCIWYPHVVHGSGVQWCADYDWGDRPNDISAANVISPYGYYYRNCTDYVAWRLDSLGVGANLYKGLGNAKDWPDRAAGKGIGVNGTPAAGAVAVRTSGFYGHTAFIEEVNPAGYPAGTIKVAQYNNYADGNFSVQVGTPSTLGFSRFIHFEAYEAAPTPPPAPAPIPEPVPPPTPVPAPVAAPAPVPEPVMVPQVTEALPIPPADTTVPVPSTPAVETPAPVTATNVSAAATPAPTTTVTEVTPINQLTETVPELPAQSPPTEEIEEEAGVEYVPEGTKAYVDVPPPVARPAEPRATIIGTPTPGNLAAASKPLPGKGAGGQAGPNQPSMATAATLQPAPLFSFADWSLAGLALTAASREFQLTRPYRLGRKPAKTSRPINSS
ncbi:MAG TPA: CHAP domain-containing protein [Nevskiaceae bacterium]|nr:CHAP domain-containing protein [Nevskiaceae bacterium]